MSCAWISVPSGGSGESFLFFAAVLGALLIPARLLRVRRRVAVVAALIVISSLVACGLWREAAGHEGLGTIAPVRSGFDLMGHGAARIRPRMIAVAMTLGLLLETALILFAFRARAPHSRAREVVWSGVVLALWCGTIWFLRFDPLTRLHSAAAHGRAVSVTKLLERSPELVDQQHFRRLALWRAARGGDAPTVAALLEAGADPKLRIFVPTREGSPDPFMQAAAGGHVEAARLLLRAGVEPEPHDEVRVGYLHLAMSEARPELVRLLLDEGALVNALAMMGEELQTALFFARDPRSTGALLEHGADPRIGTPLHGALRGGPEVIRLLLEAGADPNRLDAQGRSALGLASTECARVLLEAGADPTRGDALLWAVRCNHTGTVKLLLEAGADPLAPGADGERPIEAAQVRVVRELLEASEQR